MFERFNVQARNTLVEAQHEARRLGHDHIGTGHLLLGLSKAGGHAARLFEARSIGEADLRERLLTFCPAGKEPTTGKLPFTPESKQSLELTLREALRDRSSTIDTGHLLTGLVLSGDEPIRPLLGPDDLADPDKARTGLRAVREAERTYAPAPQPVLPEEVRRAYTKDLVRIARAVEPPPLVARERQLDRALEVLAGIGRNNLLLLGASGSGKTALAEAIAHRIDTDDGAAAAIGIQVILTVDWGRIAQGAPRPTDRRARLAALIEALTESDYRTLLVLDDVDRHLDLTAHDDPATAALAAAVEAGALRVVLTGTIAGDADRLPVARSCEPIPVPPLSAEDSITALTAARSQIGKRNMVDITDEAIAAAVEASAGADRQLPGAATELLDRASGPVADRHLGNQARMKAAATRAESALRAKEAAIASEDFEAAVRWRDAEARLRSAHERMEAAASGPADGRVDAAAVRHVLGARLS